MTLGDMPALVDCHWLHARRDDPDLVVIEIAGMGQEQRQAYIAGHVPGAVCWPWLETLWDERQRDFPAPAEFARRLGAAGIGAGTRVVVYGAPLQFGVYAWWTLRYGGHARVAVLDGGRTAWQAAGLPLSTVLPAPRAAVDCAVRARDEAMRIRRGDMLHAVEAGRHFILDGRSAEEYRGERVGAPGNPDTGALRYGRIPGARHSPFEALLDDQSRFKPAAALRAQFAAQGVPPAGEIVTYCRMSHRATVLYFALTELLGRRGVRVYDGSWTEWGNLVGVPVER